MGATAGIHINDEAVHGSDALGTSSVLAAAIRKAAPDLVLCGMASTDGSMGVLPSMIAERLGWPAATLGATLAVADGKATIRRDADTASLTIEADLPAVVSVTDQSGEARYPSMRGILAAKKKPVESGRWRTWTSTRRPSAWRRPGPRCSTRRPGRPRRPARSSPTTTGPDRPRWWNSWPPASTSEESADDV